jgi:hypothetical protein
VLGCVGEAPVFIKVSGGIPLETKEDTNKTTSGERSMKEKQIREDVRNVIKKEYKEGTKK